MSLVRAVAALKQKGFTFIGPVTLLSFVQAAGLVNHHKPDCWCFDACERQFRAAKLALLSGEGTSVSSVSSGRGGGSEQKVGVQSSNAKPAI